MNEKVLIAMSGGVDSSVAALLLKQSGYDCMGAMMKLFSPEDIVGCPKGAEQASENAQKAKEIADRLHFPFTVLDLSADFSENVMDYFVNAYENGQTPNPCVQCNRTMKFGKLLQSAMSLGCQKLATGHYAQITKDAGGRMLLRCAKDEKKDQTYVLWSLSQEQLSRILFPLGGYRKDEIREIAAENGFSNAHQSDSQDICFIPDGDYVSFISHRTKKSFPDGNFVNRDGDILGTHHGVIHYTIGQRKGLGIAFGKPTYVCGKDAVHNTVLLGSDDDLFSRDLTAHSVNLIATDRLDAPIRVQAKIRYKAIPAWATAAQTGEDTLSLHFDEPQRAISPGQSVVLYDGDIVVGGGIID